jgi:two-component system, chemotaxis family, response regulator Rcp1
MTEAQTSFLAEILLVEDNPGDVTLTRVAMSECKIANQLHIARDGVEALAFLRREGKFAGAVRPDLILLDLNLPRLDGRELLATIKQDPNLTTIPVVVLTTSDAERDVAKSYSLHANAYVTKPLEMSDFIEVVKGIEEFWFGCVRLPPRESRPPR